MTESTGRIGGVIPCGGDSRRMGESKPWLTVGGEHMLTRVTRIVSQIVAPVVVVARRGQSLPPLPDGTLVAYDRVEDAGPLEGISAGMAALEGCCEAALVVACDHPLVRPALLRALIESLGGHRAIVPICRGKPFPLLAVYRLELRTLADEMLSRRQRRVREFAHRCGAAEIRAETLTNLDPDLDSFINANDGEGYKDALQRMEPEK